MKKYLSSEKYETSLSFGLFTLDIIYIKVHSRNYVSKKAKNILYFEMEDILINNQSLGCSTYILKWRESINKQEAYEGTK